MVAEGFIQIWTFLFFVGLVTSTADYRTCGEYSAEESIESIVDDHIRRLMALRHTDWGWYNTPEVILSLQLSKQQSFFARDKALKAMKHEFRDEVSTISLGKLSLYAMAVRSLCEDPTNFNGINLLAKIKHRLQRGIVHNNNGGTTNSRYGYALAMQALCVNGIKVGRTELNKILKSQNRSGSFDEHEAVDTTAQMMIGMRCVESASGRFSVSKPMQRKIHRANKLAISFLKSRLTHVMDTMWIGNKYSTPIALSALKSFHRSLHHGREISRKIYRSLRTCSPTEETEASTAQRLLAISNRTVLALRRSDWQCTVETDEIPTGFQLNPSEDDEATDCSEQFRADEDLFRIPISIRLLYQAGGRNGSWLIRDVKKDSTLLEIMEQAKCETDFDFEVLQTNWGPSVSSINGTTAKTSMNQYWSLQDGNTGKLLSAGVGQYRPIRSGDILFKLSTF